MARQKGKVVDKWTLHANGKSFTVGVRMVKGGYTTKFVVDEIPDGLTETIREEDENIDRLKKAVQAALEAATDLTWSRMLHVEVTGHTRALDALHVGASSANSLVINVTVVEVSKRKDGTDVHRVREKGHTYDHLPSLGLHESRWPGEDDKMSCLVADTPENREAINRVIDAMGRLQAQLMDFMSPEKVAATLERVLAAPALVTAASLVLPAPEEKKDDAAREGQAPGGHRKGSRRDRDA